MILYIPKIHQIEMQFDKRNLDVQMLRLALQWSYLEVAKDLIVRGSIENIDVSR